VELLVSGAAKLGIRLTPVQQERFQSYYDELVAWRQQVNLTSVLGYREVQVVHFLDSLTPAVLLQSGLDARGVKAIDVGSGAGLPGLPLKIAFPEMSMTLLDATAKKVRFLLHLVEKLGLEGVEVVAARAEEAGRQAEYRERFSLVLSRGVSRLPSLAEITLPFCCMGGLVVAMKKGDTIAEVREASQAVHVLGGSVREIKDISLEGLDGERHLVVIEKVRPTPQKYPRRPGMPEKRPIRS
jgi:16S rRNA (guanine527-N7)-methyltransferase